jgi:hypothetical protein
MRCATARAVNSSGPISAAIARTAGATSWRHNARGLPPDRRVGATTAMAHTAAAYVAYLKCLAICVVSRLLAAILLWFAMDFQGAADTETKALDSRDQYLSTLALQRCPAPQQTSPAPSIDCCAHHLSAADCFQAIGQLVEGRVDPCQ